MRARTTLIRWRCALPVVLGLWSWAPSAQAQTSQCASDLDSLRVAAYEAHDAVRLASATRREARIARQQYLRCAQLTVDEPFDAGCRQQQSSSSSTQVTSATASEQARQALGVLAAAVQTVELSCEFPMAGLISVPATDRPGEDSAACESFLRRRPGVPLNTLRVLCDGEMSPEACAACLDRR
jgi:hypothetical protein